MPTESVMLPNHLILCHPLFLLPSIFPSIRVFSNELAFCIKWPDYWSFSFSNSACLEIRTIPGCLGKTHCFPLLSILHFWHQMCVGFPTPDNSPALLQTPTACSMIQLSSVLSQRAKTQSQKTSPTPDASCKSRLSSVLLTGWLWIRIPTHPFLDSSLC